MGKLKDVNSRSYNSPRPIACITKYPLIAHADTNTKNADTVSAELANGSLLKMKEAMLTANAGNPTSVM